MHDGDLCQCQCQKVPRLKHTGPNVPMSEHTHSS